MKKSTLTDTLVRFVFGGVTSVIAGLVAKSYGPVVGGLFLAFPAILPASVTLLQEHDGKTPAGVYALAAVAGGVGLIVFGAGVWRFGTRGSPVVILVGATIAWFAVSALIWLLLRGFIRDEKPDHHPSRSV